MGEQAVKETRGFQTEVRQLLELMVHSLYSHKEIFLRELISNASDALDKLRFEALGNDALYEGDAELAIEVEVDKAARTVTVRDNGVGMGYQEAIDDLGTIARSGTREFFQSLTGDKARDAELIGQFGVGFYSSFIVADRVTVTSRRAGMPPAGGVRWESDGQGEFSVERREVARRGTEVVLHLREGEDEFLDPARLRAILRRYSDHISFPIRMAREDGKGSEVVNKATALWTRSKSEISDQEYREFYKHIAHDLEDPLAWVHSRVEGKLEYTALLYLPARAPFDLWDRNVRRGVHLYVRRVFIMDDAEQLMPPYLRFVRGVIDSADLPLNISREMLQDNRQIEAIRGGCVKKVLDLLARLAREQPEDYARFWDQFGRVLKEGIVDDPKNREAIAALLRFATSTGEGPEQRVSLDEYVERMKPGQEQIFYLTADSYRAALNSPHLEALRERGVEVLLLSDEVDEWVVHHLERYRDKPLRSVAKGEIDLEAIGGERDEEGDKEGDKKDSPDAHRALCERLERALGERVKAVRVTARLKSSPACLVADEHDLGAHLERLLRAAGRAVEGGRPILEINPTHPLLERYAAAGSEPWESDLPELLLDQARLAEGAPLEDPAAFVQRMNRMILALAEPRRRRAGATRKGTARGKGKGRSEGKGKSGGDGAAESAADGAGEGDAARAADPASGGGKGA